MQELRSTLETALYKYQLDQKIKASETQYRLLFENIHDGVILVDNDGKILKRGTTVYFTLPGYDGADTIKDRSYII